MRGSQLEILNLINKWLLCRPTMYIVNFQTCHIWRGYRINPAYSWIFCKSHLFIYSVSNLAVCDFFALFDSVFFFLAVKETKLLFSLFLIKTVLISPGHWLFECGVGLTNYTSNCHHSSKLGRHTLSSVIMQTSILTGTHSPIVAACSGSNLSSVNLSRRL